VSPLTRGARQPSTSFIELVVALKGTGNRGLRRHIVRPRPRSSNYYQLQRTHSLSRKRRAYTGICVQNTYVRMCVCRRSLLLQRHALVTCTRVLRVVSPNHLLYLFPRPDPSARHFSRYTTYNMRLYAWRRVIRCTSDPSGANYCRRGIARKFVVSAL